jgi:hypothetical protein
VKGSSNEILSNKTSLLHQSKSGRPPVWRDPRGKPSFVMLPVLPKEVAQITKGFPA